MDTVNRNMSASLAFNFLILENFWIYVLFFARSAEYGGGDGYVIDTNQLG